MTKKKTTKTEMIASSNPATAKGKTRKAQADKHEVSLETDFERREREQRQRYQRQLAEQLADPVTRTIVEQRKRQAAALWSLYRTGDVIKQTLILTSSEGTIEKEVLLSHQSRNAKIYAK